MKLRFADQNQGFTLIELLVTIILSSVILGSMGLLFGSGLRGNRTANSISNVSINTEVAAELLQSELRQAGYLGGDARSFDGDFPPTDDRRINFENLLQSSVAGWPFLDAGVPFNPISQIDAGAAATMGPVCNANALGDGCIETFRLVQIQDEPPDSEEAYILAYVRYFIRLENDVPTLYRLAKEDTDNNAIFCNGADHVNRFWCNFPNQQLPALQAVPGIEELLFFESGDAPGDAWTSMADELDPGRRLGIYFRIRSQEEELTGDSTFSESRINLPAGAEVDIDEATDGFRRQERWLDINIPNN